MHHGSGSQNMQRQLQRSKSVSGQQATVNHPPSPVTTFTSAPSPSAPQSPNYQIIMSRSPVTGQNMNITLQNVGQMVTGNQQITLTPVPIQNPASPGFQHTAPQWRFEHAPSSYIQVTSPVPQPLQPQSPTQHSPVPLQGVTRPGAPATALGVCGQSPTRFVEAGMLVRQISLGSPSGSGHFVYQEGTGLAQIAQATPGQIQLASPGTPGSVRERRLSQPHSQTGGTIHHLGPQSPVASGPALSTLGSPGHITTSNLPPQISSIIQGQLARPMIFEKTSQGVVAGVGTTATASFSIPSSIPPSSPSLTSPTQGIPNNPLAPTSMSVATIKKQAPKKLEEIAPSTPEIAHLRKLCLEHNTKKMESLKEVFKEYLIELFFLQHLQGNMMDYVAFKKKPCVPLYTYLRQNDLDLEDEEEEEEQSEVINDEVKVVTGKDGQAVTPVAIATQLPPNVSAAFSVQQQFQGHQGVVAGTITNPGDMDAFKRQQAMVQADQAKRSRIDVGRHGLIFQHPGVALGSPGVPLQQLMPTAQGGMPPTPQAVQIAGQKQNQQQYDPSKGPPVQNAASLHTPPPQLPGRLPQGALPMAGLSMTHSQQAQLVENTAQSGGQLQAQVKVQAGGPVLATVNPHTQLQTVALARPGTESNQPVQRIMTNSISMASLSPAPNSVPTPHTASPLRPLGLNINPSTQSKLTGTNGISTVKIGAFGQSATMQSSQEGSQDKQVEQAKLESQVHQRISELRKEGQWSASRLPKLVEASRPKSHWDYLLEEMQWMAADFAQERRWKEAAAKKLVRTCARYHQEQKKSEERSKKEREIHLRHIASTIAREVEFFWSNIEQVVEIKLQFEIYEKRLKALSLQKYYSSLCLYCLLRCFCIWLSAEMPLDALKKQYAGAYIDSFEWPQPSPHSDEDETECPAGSPPEAVLIDSLLSVDQYRGADKATSSDSDRKPARDIAEVAAATELILPKGSFRTTSSVRHASPFLLHGSLREYQQIGVDWLVNLHKKHLNGILADETGLGKTVQTVAYMAQLAGQEGIWGPHLIVVRTCKLLNWEVEFKRWCPGLKILVYLGNRRDRRSKRMWWGDANSFHVCVTSYKLLMKDQSHFLRRRWRHLVLDEVQLIKNMTQKHWETIFALRSEQRILLINTPLQNTLKELWTMIHFLLPGITRSYSDFPVKAGTDQNQDYCHKLVIRLHRMIQPFILRRSKRDVEKQLPKKYEHILKCRLSTRQKSLYEDILTQPGAQEALKTGHFVSVLQVLMQLQRVCNHPELVAPRETSSSYFCSSLQYNVPSLVLGALQNDSSKIANMSIFDLINNENRLTRYQTEEAVPKLKITQQLIEEIHNAPEPPPRPKPCPIKPMRLFQPVQYGTKPEGRLAAIPSAAGQRPLTSSPATSTSVSTTNQSAQARGKSPVTTATTTHVLGASSVALGQTLAGTVVGSIAPISQPALAQVPRPALAPSHAIQPSLLSQRLVLTSQAQARLPSGDVVKIAQLANIAGSQNRISQPETPVTLQFQGNKFTLSPSQLRQLTTGQPLQLQGNILQIVSAPGQQIIRPQGSMVMQTMPQAVPATNASATPGTPHPTLSTAQQVVGCTISHCNVQESSEEKTQQLKERLSRLFEANERRCSRRVLYGSDLLQACTLSTEPGHSALTAGGWKWVGRESCLRAQRTSVAPPPHLYAANPPVPYSLEQKSLHRRLQKASAPHSADIHHLAPRHLLRFSDLQLMQMDSGKLEALAILLQKLRSDSRRVLIFTQMVKMLDILEAFLDYRQLTYVRVDESFTPDERQENMKKFNRNRNVFCSILTKRCCSAVGTLFDADTIIFYDTDLNPSMDARCQEWCDKIGRSKDIHIYRLESGNSIEEKLLKNGTKDLIREVAAQGTDYTLAFLTQRTIQDLFEVEAGSGEKVEEFVVLHQEPSASEAISPRVARPYIQALHSINLDALPVKEEQQEEEELADKESTEDNQESESQAQEEPAQKEELNAVMEQVPLLFSYTIWKLEEERLECSKRGWELQQLQKLKEEGEEQQIMEGDEDLFTYTREDAYNMEYVFDAEDGHTEIMPLWTPPTPPQDDNDIYIDSVMMLMYDTTPMPESKLPPIYIRKEHKRLKMDPSAAARKKKKGHGETVIPPRSLFEKASMLKVRREGKDQKKNFSLKQQAPFAKPLPSLVKPAMEASQDNPEWLISEDWALLQAVKQLLELPLNLTIVSPAHTPNWDLVSDVVNSCSRIYRSPKQCRNRYENVIIPREEGKSKNSRPLRTCQIYTQDDNATHIQLYNSRFELMKIIASKRSPPIKPLLGMNPFQKNPKHASVLAESGISYDKPLPPIQVASQRAERIAKEKKALAEQQKAQQLAQQQQAGTPQAAVGQAQTPAAGQAQVPQAATVAGAASVPNAAVLVRIKTPLIYFSLFLPATVGGNVIVNTVAGVPPSPFQANKRLASSVIPGTLSPAGAAGAQVVHAQQRAVTAAAAAPAEVVAIATGQGVRAVTPVTASAVVSTTLSPVQSQTRPLVSQVTPATGLQLQQAKPLTPAQLQMLRQQQQQQQQQQLQHQQQLQLQQQQVAAAVAAAQSQQAAGAQQAAQVQPAQAAQANPQLAAVAAPRPGAVLTGTTVANLQVARLTRVPTQGQIQAQAGQTAQVTLTKPPVVSVPAVVSSAGVTTLPVTVAGISVAISQPQKAGVLKGIGSQQVTVQAAQPAQQSQQKVTYATTTQLQPGIKTQFFTTSIAQAQKPTGAQQIQVAKLPQIVQQQPTVANIQQIVSSPQQAQTVTLTQAATSSPAQVQMIPAGTAQVVQQKIIQQQVVTTATSPQIQTPPPHSPAQQPAAPPAESPVQQPAQPQQPTKGQARQGGIRAKTPAKPSGGSS
uniref:E1A binding protein p400 n=1 Tax=Sander lucioperca TaxID=283035 RepID=A0A8C9X8T6_SANLU